MVFICAAYQRKIKFFILNIYILCNIFFRWTHAAMSIFCDNSFYFLMLEIMAHNFHRNFYTTARYSYRDFSPNDESSVSWVRPWDF